MAEMEIRVSIGVKILITQVEYLGIFVPRQQALVRLVNYLIIFGNV